MSTRQRAEGWRGRPAVAALLAWFLLLLPSTVAVLVAIAAAGLLPPPGPTLSGPVWVALVAGSAIGTWAGLLWGARRLSSLPFLLRLTLVFPDDTPSRWKVARQAVQAGPLAARIRRGGHLTDDRLPPTAGGVLALVTALEAHDSFTRGHAERVRLYVTLLAEELDVPVAERAKLSWAALLHDIGKLKVPATTLNSTEQLTDEQWHSLRAHPALGRRLCAPLAPWLGDWLGAVTDHHERWDGEGYPRGLAGEDISLAGRITAVADTFEVMTAGRPYAAPKPPDAARTELVACAGSQFDPRVVRAALRMSLGSANRLRTFVASVVPLPLLRLAERVHPTAWQSAVLATGLSTAALTGVLALPEPPRTPPAAPVAEDAPSPSDEDLGPALALPDPPRPRTPAADATSPTVPTRTPDTPRPPDPPGPAGTPDAAPSPGATPPPGPGTDEPTALAVHREPVATTAYLSPARPRDHESHVLLPLTTDAPPTAEPIDGDSDRGAGTPGITLDPQRPTQRWGAQLTGDGVWAGPVTVRVWAALPGHAPGQLALRAALVWCSDTGCEELTADVLRGASDGAWTELGGPLVPPPGVVRTTHGSRLEVWLSSLPDAGPVWVAPASQRTPSRVEGGQLQPTAGVLTTADTGVEPRTARAGAAPR